eukprot:gene49146-66789_t
MAGAVWGRVLTAHARPQARIRCRPQPCPPLQQPEAQHEHTVVSAFASTELRDGGFYIESAVCYGKGADKNCSSPCTARELDLEVDQQVAVPLPTTLRHP